MVKYIARKMFAVLTVLFVVSFVTFFIIHLTPGDPARVMLGADASEEAVENLREQMGLNRPLPVQYVEWLGNVLRGNLGDSIFMKGSMTSIIGLRMKPTVELTVFALVIAVFIAIPTGILAARGRGRLVDQGMMAVSMLGVSVPNFLLGLLLVLLFAAPAVCGLSAVSYTLSDFIFAEGYEAGYPVIIFTSCAMLFMGLTEYANKAYELEQSTTAILQNSAIAAVIKIVASLILIRTAGYLAAALGSVIAFISYFLITVFRVRSRFLFHVPAKSLVKIFGSALLCGAAAFGCTRLPVGNLVRLAAAVLCGASVYAACIIGTGEGKPELQAITARLKRR